MNEVIITRIILKKLTDEKRTSFYVMISTMLSLFSSSSIELSGENERVTFLD